jgi:hypothetical protein
MFGWWLQMKQFFENTWPMQWYATHDEEGHEQDLEIQVLHT